MDENTPKWVEIAQQAQRIANERGGDYAALTADELLGFMVQYDNALTKYEDGSH